MLVLAPPSDRDERKQKLNFMGGLGFFLCFAVEKAYWNYRNCTVFIQRVESLFDYALFIYVIVVS